MKYKACLYFLKNLPYKKILKMNDPKVIFLTLILGFHPGPLSANVTSVMDVVDMGEDIFLDISQKFKKFLCGTKQRVMNTDIGRGINILLCENPSVKTNRIELLSENTVETLPGFPLPDGMNFVIIEPDAFKMGSPENERGRRNNEDQVDVRITRPFEIMTTEVTQGQWVEVMRNNPSKSKRHCVYEYRFGTIPLCPTHPVENVSWIQVQEFIKRLNGNRTDCQIRPFETSGCFRLPTEAEWELAARGGEMTAYSFGDNPNLLDAYGWYEKNSQDQTQRVGQKKPNDFGLYDVHGNVAEWVEDIYIKKLPGGDDPLVKSRNPIQTFHHGKTLRRIKHLDHTIRGGSWLSFARDLRSASRDLDRDSYVNRYKCSDVGFRLAKTL